MVAITGDRFPNFFIPREAGLFHEDTWINLDYLTEFDAAGVARRLAEGRIRPLSCLARAGLRFTLAGANTRGEERGEEEKRWKCR